MGLCGSSSAEQKPTESNDSTKPEDVKVKVNDEAIGRTMTQEEVTHKIEMENEHQRKQREQQIAQLRSTKRASVLGAARKTNPSAYLYYNILGKGSFGQVVRVQNKLTKQYYALKILDIQKMDKLLGIPEDSPRGRSSSMAEEKIMKVLDHPFICRLEETFESKLHIFLVLELLHGKTLGDMLEEKKCLPIEQARSFAAQILMAIGYVHDLKIVHRDLKPDNLMITPSGHIKLMDFGVAFRLTAEHNTSDRKIGAPGFKAPEMLSGHEYGYSVDWWNFGVLLYFMLCGKHPFESSGIFAASEDTNALKKDVTFPKTLPVPARDLIAKLLVRDPEKRLGCGGQLGESHCEEIQVHPFFAGVDFDDLFAKGQKDRFDANLFPKDEKPEFADVEEVLKRFDDTDVAVQLDNSGML